MAIWPAARVTLWPELRWRWQSDAEREIVAHPVVRRDCCSASRIGIRRSKMGSLAAAVITLRRPALAGFFVYWTGIQAQGKGMRHSWVLATIAVATLAGCMPTKPASPDEVKSTPAGRVLAFQNASDGDATIVVTRDVGWVGHGCQAAVYLDGAIVAKMEPGERAMLHVPSGDHVIGTWGTGGGLCGIGEGKDRREIGAILKTGDVKKYRIGMDPNTGPTIAPTTL